MNSTNISISNADLVRMVSNGVISARRDKEIMKAFGIDDDYINTMETDKNLLRAMPTDVEIQEAVTELTNDKNHKREIVHGTISSIMVRAKNTFGPKSTELRGFEGTDLSRLTDSEMVGAADSVKRMSIKMKDKLSAKGLTDAMIAAFGVEIDDFDKSLDALSTAERKHQDDTESRSALALKLYNEMAEVFDYGKNYWRGKDALKFADYVIYDTPANTKNNKPTGSLHGTVTHAVTGEALAGVLLELSGTKLIATTDAKGHFLFSQAPVSIYTLSCSLAGMKPLEKANLAVTAGNDTACEIAMQPV